MAKTSVRRRNTKCRPVGSCQNDRTTLSHTESFNHGRPWNGCAKERNGNDDIQATEKQFSLL